MPARRKTDFSYGYVVVGIAFLIEVVTWGSYFAFGVFFKPLLEQFGWTRAMTSGAFSLSQFTYGSLGILMGGLSDRFGPRLVLSACSLLLGLGFLLMSRVTAVWQLYLLYGVMIGIGISGSYVPLASTVARWFIKRRGMMTGIILAGTGIGTLSGPPLATWLISIYDWRISYIILGLAVLLFAIVAAQFLRSNVAPLKQAPDTEKPEKEFGLQVATRGFSFSEAIRTRQFWMVLGIFFCFGFWLLAILVHIAPHATDLGFSATDAASILAAIGGASIIGKIAWGNAVDKIGNKKVLIFGFGLAAGSFLWLTSITELWTLYLFAVASGLAYGACSSPQSPLTAELFGLSSHGLMLGIIESGLAIGGSVGPLVAGYLFDVYGNYQVAFLLCAVAGIIGLVLAALLTPITEEGRPK